MFRRTEEPDSSISEPVPTERSKIISLVIRSPGPVVSVRWMRKRVRNISTDFIAGNIWMISLFYFGISKLQFYL